MSQSRGTNPLLKQDRLTTRLPMLLINTGIMPFVVRVYHAGVRAEYARPEVTLVDLQPRRLVL